MTGAPARDAAVVCAAALVAALFLDSKRAPWWWAAFVWAFCAWTAWAAFHAFSAARPPHPVDVSLVRACVAAVALAALARERVPSAPARNGVVLGVLWLCGALGFLCFYNLGAPQFRDAGRGQPSFVHYLDHRQYYATAKYFPEIGYRGLYLADLAAAVDDDPQLGDELLKTKFRDLTTHRMVRANDQREAMAAVKSRFTPERWASYKEDARYFRQAMGKAYFDFMVDYGGNAAPAWIAVAHILYNAVPLNAAGLTALGAIDAVLVLLAALAIARCFGVRTALVCLTVFGANDFIMYGSNWGGAVLRHDWLAALALGACALRRRRWQLAGAIFGWATTIRAFPAVSLVALVFPLAWWVWDERRASGRWPSFADLRAAHAGTFRVWASAAITIAVVWGLTSLLFSPSAWADWWQKVTLLSVEPHANHIGLRSLIGGWEGNQWLVLKARRPVFELATLACVGLVFAACRRKTPDQAAVWGLALVPILFYPANYYLHFVCWLPLLADEADGSSWLPAFAAPLALCITQYFTVPVTPWGVHFFQATVLLFVTLGWMLTARWRADAAGNTHPSPER